jgi:hypothetical protein
VNLRIFRKQARRKPAAVPRGWFRDRDGTYYRNFPLVKAEFKLATETGLTEVAAGLVAELEQIVRGGVIRKAELGPGDTEVCGASFSEAYPAHPALRALDDGHVAYQDDKPLPGL